MSLSTDEKHPHISDDDEPHLITDEMHPGAAPLFARCPGLRYIPVLGGALAGFGPSVVFSLFLTYFCAKGAVSGFLNQSMQPMLNNRMKATTEMLQRLTPLAKIGGSLKALTACLTDAFALFHYTKRWYLFISAILTGVFCIIYASLPGRQSSLNAAGAMIFLSFLANATIDILSQGHYSRLIKRKQATGPLLISWVNFAMPCGAIVAAVIQGPVSDKGLPQVGLYVAGGLVLLTSLSFIFNWYCENKNRANRHEDAILLAEERKLARELALQDNSPAQEEGKSGAVREGEVVDLDDVGLESGEMALSSAERPTSEDDDFEEPIVKNCIRIFEFNQEIIRRNWKLFIYSLVISACVIAMVCVIILGTTWALLYTMIAIAVICIIGAYLALPLAVAKATTFLFFNQIWYLNISSPLTNFYTAPSSCIVDGPHFSYTFYNVIGAVLGNVGTIVGVLLFAYVFSKHKFYIVFSTTSILYILASFFDLIMVQRWNIAIGIPDHAMYVFGDAIVLDMCAALADMPTAMLLARLCPRGSESLVYAVVASMGNIGGTFSGSIASVIMETRLPVSNTIGSCDFSNLKWLIMIGHMLTPLLNIPLSYFLLPNARICDEVDMDGKVIVHPKKGGPKASKGVDTAQKQKKEEDNIAYLSSNDEDDEAQRRTTKTLNEPTA